MRGRFWNNHGEERWTIDATRCRGEEIGVHKLTVPVELQHLVEPGLGGKLARQLAGDELGDRAHRVTVDSRRIMSFMTKGD